MQYRQYFLLLKIRLFMSYILRIVISSPNLNAEMANGENRDTLRTVFFFKGVRTKENNRVTFNSIRISIYCFGIKVISMTELAIFRNKRHLETAWSKFTFVCWWIFYGIPDWTGDRWPRQHASQIDSHRDAGTSQYNRRNTTSIIITEQKKYRDEQIVLSGRQ